MSAVWSELAYPLKRGERLWPVVLRVERQYMLEPEGAVLH